MYQFLTYREPWKHRTRDGLAINKNISEKFKSYFLDTTNTLVAYIELLVYFYFFRKILEGNKIKKIMTGLAAIYSVVIIIFLTTKFIKTFIL